MYKTHARPSRDLRNHYADVIRDLQQHDQVIITNNGRGEAVLIGMEDYAAYEEFLHVRYVQKKLAEAEEMAKEPGNWLTEEEFWKDLF